MDELDERAFLFRIQVGTDAELLRRIARSKINKLSLCSRFKLHGRVMLRSRLLEISHIRRVNVILIKFELLCCAGRLSISRVTFFTLQCYLTTAMYSDGALVIWHLEL